MALSYETVTTYFRDKLGVDTTDLTPETPLFSSSLIDSFAMVRPRRRRPPSRGATSAEPATRSPRTRRSRREMGGAATRPSG